MRERQRVRRKTKDSYSNATERFYFENRSAVENWVLHTTAHLGIYINVRDIEDDIIDTLLKDGIDRNYIIRPKEFWGQYVNIWEESL